MGKTGFGANHAKSVTKQAYCSILPQVVYREWVITLIYGTTGGDAMDEGTLHTLLEQWESVYKKGLLSFWLLLSTKALSGSISL